MKKNISFIAAVTVFTIAATAQTSIENNRKPDERIIVNKEFDEQGNLLRYDSAYSFQWFSDTTFSLPDFGGWETFFNKGKSFPNFFNDSMLFDMPFFKNFPKDFFFLQAMLKFQFRFPLTQPVLDEVQKLKEHYGRYFLYEFYATHQLF